MERAGAGHRYLRNRRSDHIDCYVNWYPCGFANDPTRECTCSASTIARYQKRISGPLLDRIDIHVEAGAGGCATPRSRRALADKEQPAANAAVQLLLRCGDARGLRVVSYLNVNEVM